MHIIATIIHSVFIVHRQVMFIKHLSPPHLYSLTYSYIVSSIPLFLDLCSHFNRCLGNYWCHIIKSMPWTYSPSVIWLSVQQGACIRGCSIDLNHGVLSFIGWSTTRHRLSDVVHKPNTLCKPGKGFPCKQLRPSVSAPPYFRVRASSRPMIMVSSCLLV